MKLALNLLFLKTIVS